MGITFSSTLGIENIFIKQDLQSSFGQGTANIFNAMSTTSWSPNAEGQSVTKWDSTRSPLSIHDNVDKFLRTASNQNYSLELQQQYGSTAVFASLNYLEDKSIIPGNKLTRVNFTSKATTHFGKDSRWTSDVKMSYNNTGTTGRSTDGIRAVYLCCICCHEALISTISAQLQISSEICCGILARRVRSLTHTG